MKKFTRIFILSIFCFVLINVLHLTLNEEEKDVSVFQTVSQTDENIECVYLWTDGLTTENFMRYFAFFNDKSDFLIKEIYPNYNDEILEENKIVIEQKDILESLDIFLQKYKKINNVEEDKVISIKAVRIMAKKKDIVSFLKRTHNILYSYNMEGPYNKFKP